MEESVIINNSKKKIILLMIVLAALLVAVIGISFSFFNYTRSGEANTVRTGRIAFNAVQGNTLNITNVFPIESSDAATMLSSLDGVTLAITGDTTYVDGEEFEITLTGVNNTVNGKQIPISYIATYEANTGGSIGEFSDSYWTSKENKNANIYTINSRGIVREGKQVLVGYIKSGANGINGTLTIKAYIDGDMVAITDTLENGPIVATDYTNGTTSEWVNGRTVLTTEEWRSFISTGLSFRLTAKSQEGLWVERQNDGTIDSCPGCVFTYSTDSIYTTWNTGNNNPTVVSLSAFDFNYVVKPLNSLYNVQTTKPKVVKLDNVNPTFSPTPTPTPGRPSTTTPTPTPTSTQTVNIQASVIWDDDNNVHNVRPSSVTISLYGDGVIIDTVTITAENDWTYTFSTLPLVDNNGETINYSIRQTAVSNYETIISGLTITNRLIPQATENFTDITGTITWVDNDNATGNRPNVVAVSLFRDNIQYEIRSVTVSNNWSYTFSNVPLDDGFGNTYTYTISVQNIVGYNTRIDGFNIICTSVSASPPSSIFYSYDYREIISRSGKNYFLGLKLDDNNKIIRAYACGLKGDIPFCIEGTSDGSKYSNNQILLQSANLWNNNCTANSSSTTCLQSSGSVSADAFSNGVVSVGDNSISCSVNASGSLICTSVITTS